jgi:hypothetical protein
MGRHVVCAVRQRAAARPSSSASTGGYVRFAAGHPAEACGGGYNVSPPCGMSQGRRRRCGLQPDLAALSPGDLHSRTMWSWRRRRRCCFTPGETGRPRSIAARGARRGPPADAVREESVVPAGASWRTARMGIGRRGRVGHLLARAELRRCRSSVPHAQGGLMRPPDLMQRKSGGSEGLPLPR